LTSARPEDLYGLKLSTSDEAASSYNDALGRILRLESDPHEPLLEAVTIDPEFALGHLALGVLSHEFGLDDQTSQHLARARALLPNTTIRERQFIDAYEQRVAGDYAPLLAYLLDHPRDVLGVSIAIPTIAFSGAYDVADDAWIALEEMASHFTSDWWYDGMMAFARQDQGRMDEARDLAERSLSTEPRGGNAAHAAAHVYLETGDHELGLEWINGWIASAGQDAAHRCHFSWHAALYELSLNDLDAVERRFTRELSPQVVTGARALIDSASLMFRGLTEDFTLPSADADAVLAAAGLPLTQPETPFMAFHCGLGLALVSDISGLHELSAYLNAWEPTPVRSTLLTVIDALIASCEGDASRAADLLLGVHHQLTPIGGSFAQRSVATDLAISSLCRAGRGEEAVELLESRLARRARPRDEVLLQRARHATSGT
jgi:tetratricopeptide (TPR) repeat protein